MKRRDGVVGSISEAIIYLQDNLTKSVRMYLTKGGQHLVIRDNDGGHDLHVCYFPATRVIKCLIPRGVVNAPKKVEPVEVVVIIRELVDSLDL